MPVIEKQASATACPMLRAITALNVKKTTGRLPVARGAKSVRVIQLDQQERSVNFTMASVTADKGLVEDDVTNAKTTSGATPRENASLVTVVLWV